LGETPFFEKWNYGTEYLGITKLKRIYGLVKLNPTIKMANRAQGNMDVGVYKGGQFLTYGYDWYYCGRSNGQNSAFNDVLKHWIEALPEEEREALEQNLEAEAQDIAHDEFKQWILEQGLV
jgi:hypothetical protein